MPVPGARAAWRALFLGLVAAVLWLALTPSPPQPLDTGWDKLNHLLAFAALGFTGRFAFAPARLAVLWDAVSLLLLGVAIEGLQSLVPSRSAQWQDVVADALGIGAGLLIAALAGAACRRRRTGLASNALPPASPHNAPIGCRRGPGR